MRFAGNHKWKYGCNLKVSDQQRPSGETPRRVHVFKQPRSFILGTSWLNSLLGPMGELVLLQQNLQNLPWWTARKKPKDQGMHWTCGREKNVQREQKQAVTRGRGCLHWGWWDNWCLLPCAPKIHRMDWMVCMLQRLWNWNSGEEYDMHSWNVPCQSWG